MKSFRTEFIATPSSLEVSHASSIFTIGSCFSEALGSLFRENKFSVAANPLGTIYNPISIHQALRYAIQQDVPAADTYVRLGEHCAHYHFPSGFTSRSQDETAGRVREAIAGAHSFLAGSTLLIMTYGTAWVFERRDTGEIVANCHKAPADRFEKKLLTAAAIVASFEEICALLKNFRQEINIVLTVSPVRHLKDTLELNSVSKSVLRVAVHEILERHPEISYFPAYEIVLDDLRDYRFYADDLLHPSPAALRYVWQKFSDSYFRQHTTRALKEWAAVSASLAHRPQHPESIQHQDFLRDTLGRLEELNSVMNVQQEINHLRTLLP